MPANNVKKPAKSKKFKFKFVNDGHSVEMDGQNIKPDQLAHMRDVIYHLTTGRRPRPPYKSTDELTNAIREADPNEHGCKPFEDVCLAHDEPLTNEHGCEQQKTTD